MINLDWRDQHHPLTQWLGEDRKTHRVSFADLTEYRVRDKSRRVSRKVTEYSHILTEYLTEYISPSPLSPIWIFIFSPSFWSKTHRVHRVHSVAGFLTECWAHARAGWEPSDQSWTRDWCPCLHSHYYPAPLTQLHHYLTFIFSLHQLTLYFKCRWKSNRLRTCKCAGACMSLALPGQLVIESS